jgi:hypothetical protein
MVEAVFSFVVGHGDPNMSFDVRRAEMSNTQLFETVAVELMWR